MSTGELIRRLLPWLLLLSAVAHAQPQAVSTGSSASPAAAHTGVWIYVDTAASVAEVRRGQETLLVLERVAFGRGGVSPLRLRGEDETPLGEFRINRINPQSRFHIFLGIDYPRMEQIDAAWRRGLIDDEEYRRSLDYGLRHGEFPQDGPLGGHIGFHGIGRGDPEIHERFHWTEGCIAMTNEQVEKLHGLVDIGTPVVIE